MSTYIYPNVYNDCLILLYLGNFSAFPKLTTEGNYTNYHYIRINYYNYHKYGLNPYIYLHLGRALNGSVLRSTYTIFGLS